MDRYSDLAHNKDPLAVTNLEKKMGSSTTKISLKLLVDDKSKKVLFAEAGKDFVDFLFGLMEIPVGTIAGLLMELDHQSPIVSVYKSVKNLDPTYLQTKHQDKNALLKPKPASSSSDTFTPPLLTNLLPQSQAPSAFSFNTNTGSGGFGFPNTTMRAGFSFSNTMRAGFGIPNSGSPVFGISSHQNHPREVGYVKEVVTYMVMDDMEVKPMSSISSITLINTFNVKDVSCLKEQKVVVDEEKALKLLKALFKSNTDTVLTDVFLEKMKFDRGGF